MKIDEMKVCDLMDMMKVFGGTKQVDAPCSNSPYHPVGRNILVRTVTMILVGRLVEVWPQELVLEDAAWIADTGRYHEAFKNPSVLNEVEPYPPGRVPVGRGAVIDCAGWPHGLPREPK